MLLVVVKNATLKIPDEFHKFQKMNEGLREDFLALFDPVGLELDQEWRTKWSLTGREEPDLVKFWKIFSANGVINDLSLDDFTGVYKQFSSINHSCSSNVIPNWKEENPLKIDVRAATPIRKGEELTLNYLGLLGTWEERRLQLEREWCFQCSCEVCSLSEEARDKNDRVREFITYHMEVGSSWEVLASLFNESSVLNNYLHVLLACYSIEREAKYFLPLVLCICHQLYQVVKVRRVTWECPTQIKGKLMDLLGHRFMEILGREAVTKAEVLGSGMVKKVTDIAMGELGIEEEGTS